MSSYRASSKHHDPRSAPYGFVRESRRDHKSSRTSSRAPACSPDTSRFGIPEGMTFWDFVATDPFESEEEARLFFRDYYDGSEGGTPARFRHRRSTRDDVDDYLDLLEAYRKPQGKPSPVLWNKEVVADRHRRKYHVGVTAARQYDMTLPYVMDMLVNMYERFETVSCYSMAMLEAGMIVYYLEPFTLGLDRRNQGHGTAHVGGRVFSARVHLKGRFGIIVNKYAQSVKVAAITSFGKDGLQSKSPRIWNEYVGVRTAEAKNFYNPSRHEVLEVAQSFCDISPTSSAHLVTTKIGLSDQILIAGRITVSSLERLREMVLEMENAES